MAQTNTLFDRSRSVSSLCAWAITALVIAMISIVGIVVVQSQSIIKDNDFEKKNPYIRRVLLRLREHHARRITKRPGARVYF